MIPKNPYDWIMDNYEYDAWQECYESLIKWLFSPCTEHEVSKFDQEHLRIVMITSGSKLAKDKYREYPTFGWFYKHRHNCPECMKELKESE